MSRKLKIGFVLDDTLDTPDGVQQYVLTLGSWFRTQGHEVHYLVGQSSRNDIKNIHSLSKNVKVRFNQNRLSVPLPASKPKIRQKLKELDLDVLHVQMPYSPMMAGRIVKAAPKNTRVIGTFHIVPASWLHTASAKSLKILNRTTIRRFNKIVSVSTAAQIFAKTSLNIDSIVVPNAIDLKKFSHRPISNNKPTIVFLGRLVERKGCMYLLKALKALSHDYKANYRVLIVGKGPLELKLQSYCQQHKLSKVKFLGFVSEKEKAKILAGADIAVFPSTGGESFGIVLIEAMASGARVILGGDNVGYHTVLSDYPDLLIEPRNTKAFANRLQYFLEHPKIRKDTQKWAKIAVKQYDVSVVGKTMLKIYRNKI